MPDLSPFSLDAPGDARVGHKITHVTLFRSDVAHELK
jgi:hypothetical protein